MEVTKPARLTPEELLGQQKAESHQQVYGRPPVAPPEAAPTLPPSARPYEMNEVVPVGGLPHGYTTVGQFKDATENILPAAAKAEAEAKQAEVDEAADVQRTLQRRRQQYLKDEADLKVKLDNIEVAIADTEMRFAERASGFQTAKHEVVLTTDATVIMKTVAHLRQLLRDAEDMAKHLRNLRIDAGQTKQAWMRAAYLADNPSGVMDIVSEAKLNSPYAADVSPVYVLMESAGLPLSPDCPLDQLVDESAARILKDVGAILNA